MAAKFQFTTALRDTFPSDSLLDLWTFASEIPGIKSLLKSLVRVVVVIDANVVHRELEFRLRKRRKPEARSSLTEAIQSGAWVAIAPPFLDEEIEKYMTKIADRCHVTEEAVRGEWESLRSLFRFYTPTSKANVRELNVDPKDVPYARIREEFGADAVYTSDLDLPKMGVPIVTITFDTLVRDYSRAKAMEVGITLATGTTVSISLELLSALIKGCIATWKRIPEFVKFTIIAGIALALIHPKSRRFLVEKLRWFLAKLKTIGPPVLEVVAEWFMAYASSSHKANHLEAEVRAKLPLRAKRPAAVLARRVLLTANGPLLLTELESRMIEAGYVSQSKNFRAYLSRVLRSDNRFVELSRNQWALTPAF